MNVEEFAFAYNINSTGMSGIITMTNPPKLVCYCDEENSKTILNALNPPLPPAEGADWYPVAKRVLNGFIDNVNTYQDGDELYIKYDTAIEAMREFELSMHEQPTAEGAEEILASLIESLGEPDNSIHDHSYEIRPLTVNGKCEWWMFHNGVSSGEPLAQWLSKFATLHAHRIAEKIVEEKLIEFGNMIRDEPNGDIPALAEYFMRTINLKSR